MKANDPSASELIKRDARVLWHPFSHSATEPELLPVVSAKGAWLTLANGRKVIDGISSWWTCLHGHGHPNITDAICKQAARLDHVVFAGATHEPAVELAEKLLKIVPAGLTRVFYSDDGSTAVEVALKMAIQYHYLKGNRRRLIVALDGGYHGDTFGAMSAGAKSIFTKPFENYLFSVERIPAPADAGVESAEAALAAAEVFLTNHQGEIAAVITEPILQGAAGMRVHHPIFIKELAALCRRLDILWIADEVLTGFGRTGTLFACDRAGASPDLLCLAKGLTGGTLTLAATLCREELFEVFQTGDRGRAFFHGHSFTANPIACAAALASMDLTLQKEFLVNVERIGARLRGGLRPLEGNPNVRDIRSIGLMAAVEVAGGDNYLSAQALDLRRRAVEKGALLRPLGPVLYLLPPACLTNEEADTLTKIAVDLVLNL